MMGHPKSLELWGGARGRTSIGLYEEAHFVWEVSSIGAPAVHTGPARPCKFPVNLDASFININRRYNTTKKETAIPLGYYLIFD
eukprot:scaffold19211_cov145-Amphora_coffeaeformis.AAC.1